MRRSSGEESKPPVRIRSSSAPPAGLTYGVNGSFYGRINVLTLTGSIGWRWF